MYTFKIAAIILAAFFSSPAFAQMGSIKGLVKDADGPVPFATVYLTGVDLGTSTDGEGKFAFENLDYGRHEILISYLGFHDLDSTVVLSPEVPVLELGLELETSLLQFDEVVVTGTKTFKRKTKSAVIVNVVNSELLDDIQACNLSEGLRFQPGLRVETDCQTCNYTQLRMNGLAGGYSQILVNGRPIFSPLTGLYGMEQLPANMIDRIEVIRGGGSSLYGSSAIGGTVNVITKIPRSNSLSFSNTYQQINGRASDNISDLNGTIVSKSERFGASVFANRRQRGIYDHNGDKYSELPSLENLSFGTSAFYLPTENQKIEASFSRLREYRYGGEIFDGPAYLAGQAEERTHNVYMGSLDYQYNFNQDQSSVIAYFAGQVTDRDHYTGILPDGSEEVASFIKNPPYGTSLTTTIQGGLQLNHKVEHFLTGTNVFTLGSEYTYDDTFDDIPAYNYLIDQSTEDLGVFLQSDWEILPSLNFLSGARIDRHNLVDGLVLSPRLSLLYKYKDYTQFRASYGTGFRAPQAFDTDLHIAFAGGGISRVTLSPDLAPEFSRSFNASINYDRPTEKYVTGFTFEGFYTKLEDAFNLQPIGEDAFGEVFEKQNGQNASVRGLTMEVRANYDRKIQLEAGFTLQTSRFDEAVEYIEGLEGIKDFIRTPNEYGFATLSITPNKRWNANINYVYTGSMIVPHFAGAPNQAIDEYHISQAFSDLNFKLAYNFRIEEIASNLQVYGGVKNILNAYQNNFDIGKNRDSNFVFGPALPRTLFVGVKWML